MSSLLADDDNAARPAREHEYVVVARRYRPQSFQQLVGQDSVSQALGNAITTNRVGHAYLFTGARGVGKTSTARIFAKCLNCVTGPTTTPCGECDVCHGVATGEDVDVLEIDGASNRGIDEIRQLRSNVNVRPSRAKFKIYIIDEVHMLTMPAFNALLKTLEEPPEHVKFIFCTTEADKIPITVLSRCQRFDFAPIETRSIVERLALICKNEGVEAEDEALHLLARRAAGSMRDSQSLLEQLLSFGGKHITVDAVHAMLGTARGSRLISLANLLAERDAAAALKDIDAAVQEGVDVGQLVEQLLGLFRDVMAAHVGCTPDLYLHATPQDAPKLAELGVRLGLETTLAIVQILDQALVRMKHSTHVRTLAEIAIVQICRLEDLDGLAGLIASLKSGGKLPVSIGPPSGGGTSAKPPPARTMGAESGSSAPANDERSAAREENSNTLTPALSQGEREQEVALAQREREMKGGGPATSAPSEQFRIDQAALAPLTQRAVDAAWQVVINEMADSTGAAAQKAHAIAISAPNRLVVRFGPQYTFEKTTCERSERRQKLVQGLTRELGRTVTLDFEFLEGAIGPGVASPRPATAATRRQRMKSIEKHPMVAQAMELFEAEVVYVEVSETELAAESAEAVAVPNEEVSQP